MIPLWLMVSLAVAATVVVTGAAAYLIDRMNH